MPDDETTTAIAISTGVVGALRAAGALGQPAPIATAKAEPPPPPPAPPPPPHAVCDVVEITPVRTVLRRRVIDHAGDVTYFELGAFDGSRYELGFPPNDANWIPDLDRVESLALTANRRVTVQAVVEL